MLLNGNRNWNIPVYECLIRLNYHSHKDYNKMTETALGASSTTYRRTNKVFGLGVDYKF